MVDRAAEAARRRSRSASSMERRGDDHTSRRSQGDALGPANGPAPLGMPQARSTEVSTPLQTVYRRLLGLNPFKTTYLNLYDSLDTVLDRSIAIGSAVFAVAAGVPLPVIGYIFGQIINEFPPPEAALHDRLVQLLGVAVAYFVVTTIYCIGFGLTSETVSVKLRRKLLECLLHLDQAYLDTHTIDVSGLLTEKMDTIQAGCSEKVGIFIQALSYFVAAFVVGFLLDAELTGILLASVVPAVSICFFVLTPLVAKYNRAANEKNDQANDIAEGALGAVRIVQAFDMITGLCARHLELLNAATKTNAKKAILAALQAGAVYFIAYATNALAFYVGSRRTNGGNAGTVYAVILLILDASFVVGQFAPFLEIFARAASAKDTIQDLIDARNDPNNASTFRKTDHKPSLHGQDIQFKDVVFQYPARPTVRTLNEVSFTLNNGKFTAIVGTSGGGKSTLVALLLGIYDYSGHILVGDDDVQKIDSGYLRSQIAVLDQDTILFSGTIFDNVCYGIMGQSLTEDEKRSRCTQALKDANVDFLEQLPNGVNTRLGNELQLSGGQRQRICLARALIKNPAILVLDEPTSALDARSEVAVVDAVKKVASKGTTVIMIAHRLSTTLDADHIIVMSDGKAVEQGSPRELSGEGTIFRGLLDAQKTTFDQDREESPEKTEVLRKESSFSDLTKSEEKVTNAATSKTEELPPMGLLTVAKRLGGIIRPDSILVASGLVASVISGGIMIGQAIVFGNLITVLNTGTASPSFYSDVNFYSLIFFILALIALGSYVGSGSAFGITSSHVTGSVKARMLHKLLHLDIRWFSEPGHSTQELLSSFTKDPSDLSALGGVALGAIFSIITSTIGGVVLSLVVAWKIAVVLLAAVPVMVLAGYARLRILTASENKHREAFSEATGLAAESCRNRRAVTALCLEAHLLEEYEEALRKPHREIQTFIYLSSTLLSFCFSITYFVYALAYWWGARQVRNGTYSSTAFFIVLPALLFSAQSAGQFFSLSPEIARAKTAARSIFTLLDAKTQILLPSSLERLKERSSTTSSVSTDLVSQTAVNGVGSDGKIAKLRFDGVSLTYPNSSQPSLNKIDLSIGAGESVAFVGPSGAGKSSTVALIERFYDTTAGSVLYDGVNIREMDVRKLRSHMGLVSQDPDLFTGSVLYNVKLGAPSGETVSDEQVIAACKKCGLHDFITSLPDGYNTDCGSSSSSQLSGGQKQRLAIARALVRDPDVLLLDEPTSALDAHSEAHVQAALAEAAKGRTTVIVAHRLASIQHVDKIFVFESGRVIAHGTHAELVAEGGLYASMAKAQSLA
ncbi:putative ABC transporter [Zymoseptoria tritici IPO323]|uniref:ABC transporter n=1 Tax=Zymoseptoria tritici (strain CBS 115943 / IPO323) TaxID=336722 RepID=F9X2M3_ZYMTI|nr:putative ABC transporter [Zymoseptoria tritici IPO323]EGP90754.1 putative ABC transporter [Zymoseptoria tritici IPO323]